jgi:hypothetical protein
MIPARIIDLSILVLSLETYNSTSSSSLCTTICTFNSFASFNDREKRKKEILVGPERTVVSISSWLNLP